MTATNPLTGNQKGIALLLILWVVTLLAVVCAELSWTMRTEISIVRNFKEGEQAYYTAEAGINRAIIELMRTANSVRRTKKADEETEELEQAYWEAGSGPYRFKLGDSECAVEIEDESNKLGLNQFLRKAKEKPSLLKSLLREKAGLEGEKLDIVADSMIDWWDKDHNTTGVNGTEDDYYESLETPYESRDGDIPVIEELLLIRGIDEDIYYGKAGKPEQKIKLSSEELEQILAGKKLEDETEDEEEGDHETEEQKMKFGLCNIFSVFSRSSRIKLNANTASADQLMMLEGMDIETAREIVDARKERKFESTTDRLPQFANYEVWRKNINTNKRSSYYKIKARGYSPDGLISRNITCNVEIRRNRFKISDWKAGN